MKLFTNESAGKKKSVRISGAGVYIKPILVQCALATIKDKKHPYFRHRYETLKRRRGHKRAIIAIARILLTIIFNMLSKNEPFNSSLYQLEVNPNGIIILIYISFLLLLNWILN